MTRGNQRDMARAKAQKKQQEQDKRKGAEVKGANAGLTLEQRRERDAQILRDKQAKKAGGGEASGSGSDTKK